MDNSLFARQLAMYTSYHRDPRNRATHFIGIPAIIYSVLVALALLRFPVAGFDCSAAVIAALLAILGWIALDRAVGLAMIVAIAPLLVVAEWTATHFSTATAWIVFAVFFVGGWTFQLVGHAWERRRPALLDNLFQAFVGPMFLMAEVLMALGFKRDLKAMVDTAPSAG